MGRLSAKAPSSADTRSKDKSHFSFKKAIGPADRQLGTEGVVPGSDAAVDSEGMVLQSCQE
jgi:hypothetical protein